MTTKTDEQERAEFEAWGKTMSGWSGHRDEFGDYVCESEEFSWRAWQARAALQSQDRTAWINTLERKAEALWTAAGEDRHEAMKDLLHHARIGVQSQDREDALRYRRPSWAGVTVWVGDRQKTHAITKQEFEHCKIDVLQAAFDHARRIEGDGE